MSVEEFCGMAAAEGIAGPCEHCSDPAQNLIRGALCPRCNAKKIVMEVAGVLFQWGEKRCEDRVLSLPV
jgi:hypothetical protein